MSLTVKNIRVYSRTAEALRDIGHERCLAGSAACPPMVHGLSRSRCRDRKASAIKPGRKLSFLQDIDIVVPTDDHPEEVKAKLLKSNGPSFYLVPRKPEHYKV
ncbi:hypothetical protein AMATHDRAFT_49286 [Amanita thiersii Skay4041]|uniref:Uncharacterized protein n=1 Tax=Amanita thiersii Skay4041 TaxID=703135 RepID=A0A2A9NM00_9AGAR|nr:hypothetical protein AMATHDRAFT_49286 [Amanita thiersii Skay4041]